MDKTYLIKTAGNFIEHAPGNCISEEIAISKNSVGLNLFDAPVFAFGSADDEYFTGLKEPQAIGAHFATPKEWLPGAKTVVSFFLPFTGEVRKSNRKNMTWPSEEWLHARIEGQALLNKLCVHLKSELTEAGYPSVIPSMDDRFWTNADGPGHKEKFTSNWSERHVAFVCGHGTFGLSKGLITKNGMAGRFGSIVTELYLEPDAREYAELYEYCSMCGKCAKNCPVSAISRETGKNHQLCSDFLEETKAKHNPRYACGKCQVHVPCETKIPVHR